MTIENKNKILILYAHPAQAQSEVNVFMYQAALELEGVSAIDLYAEYPDYRIDVDREQERLRAHDVLIFQFPLYWYSTPALLKEWQDLVLEYGFAYGDNGTALHGKRFLCALTAGGAEKAYHADGYNHFTIRELLQPLEQTANLTGMRYLPPFALFSSRTATEQGRVRAHVAEWLLVIKALQEDTIDPASVSQCNILNDVLEKITSQ